MKTTLDEILVNTLHSLFKNKFKVQLPKKKKNQQTISNWNCKTNSHKNLNIGKSHVNDVMTDKGILMVYKIIHKLYFKQIHL